MHSDTHSHHLESPVNLSLLLHSNNKSRSSLQSEHTRLPRKGIVLATGLRVSALVEELQIAWVDGHRLVRVGADQIAVTNVVGPGCTTVSLSGERLALARCLRGPRASEAARGE